MSCHGLGLAHSFMKYRGIADLAIYPRIDSDGKKVK